MLRRLKKISTISKTKKVAGKYIASGLVKTFAQTVSGLIVLRWLEPESLGAWQSFTVFVGYLQILTLGVTSGLNRELPYWMGKGEKETALLRLRTAGYFTTALSIGLMVIISIIAFLLHLSEQITFDQMLMMILAFSTGSLTIQTNFLGATFRSTGDFNKLSGIQLYNSVLYFVLIPLVYFFQLWGYIAYQIAVAVALYWGYFYFRPYKMPYRFQADQFRELVKVGLPMYFWNYLASTSRSIPRLILVIWGTPLLVGLFAPAASINAAILNLPNYINRYLFPKMSYQFGKNNDKREVYRYTVKAAAILFVVMLAGATLLALIIPYAFPVFFPKYTDSILVTQIVVFSGVFYSVNSLLHNALNSVKIFKPFKFIVSIRILLIVAITGAFYFVNGDLLLSVAIGTVASEVGNLCTYLYFLRKMNSHHAK